MHVEMIQCPENGTVFKRKDGISITVTNVVTVQFNNGSKLLLPMKTSEGNLTLPLPDDEYLLWFTDAISLGKFQKEPTTYEFVEARYQTNDLNLKAFLPWCK